MTTLIHTPTGYYVPVCIENPSGTAFKTTVTVVLDENKNITSVTIPGEDFVYAPRQMMAASCFCGDDGLAGTCIHADAAYLAIATVAEALDLDDDQVYPAIFEAAIFPAMTEQEIAEMLQTETWLDEQQKGAM